MNDFRLALSPIMPIQYIIILAIIIILLLIVFYRQKPKASISRFIIFSVLIVILLNPQTIKMSSSALPDIVGILVDKSPSMVAASREKGAVIAYEKLYQDLKKIPNIIIKTGEINGDNDGTRIAQKIDALFNDDNKNQIGALFIISDGQIKDYKEIKPNYPIHQIIIGTNNEIDRYIKIIESPKFAEIGTNAKVIIKIIDEHAKEKSTKLKVTQGLNQSFFIDTNLNEETVVELPINKRGQNQIAFETNVVNNEISPNNNIIMTNIDGIRDRLKVLLVTGKPYEGARAWRNLLKSDPSIDLVHFTILRSPNKLDYTPESELSLIPFPTEELFMNKLSDFNLIVFDRFEQIDALEPIYLENIARWVENGGAFLMLSGPSEAKGQGVLSTPLARIIPIKEPISIDNSPFKPSISSEGKIHPITKSLIGDDISWGNWLSMLKANSTGKVILTGNGAPLMVVDDVKKGRIALVLSDKSWLWQRAYQNGGPFRKLFRNTAHWLMHDPELDGDNLILKSLDKNLEINLTTILNDKNIIVKNKIGETILNPKIGVNKFILQNQPIGFAAVQYGDKIKFINIGANIETIGQNLSANPNPLWVQTKPEGAKYEFIGRNAQLSFPKILHSSANLLNNKSMNIKINNQKVMKYINSQPIIPAWIFAFIIIFCSICVWLFDRNNLR